VRKEILEDIEKIAENMVKTLEKLYGEYNIVLEETSSKQLKTLLSNEPFKKFAKVILERGYMSEEKNHHIKANS